MGRAENHSAEKARLAPNSLRWLGLRELLLRTQWGQRERERRAARRFKADTSRDPPHVITLTDLQRAFPAPVFLVGNEATVLSKYAAGAESVVVEIGAAFGGSTAILLVSLTQQAQLWSIDPFVTHQVWKASQEGCRASVSRFLRAIERERLADKWTLVAKPSYEVVKGWNRGIDMVFIDGDHHYDAVKRDFEDWYPYVEKGGKLLIHDSRRIEGTPSAEWALGWPGPTRLAQELRRGSDAKLIEEVDSLTIWEKL